MDGSVAVRPRIGPILVAQGVITQEQLDQAVEAQQNSPQFTLGQLISFLHGVPAQTVDAITINHMVLPSLAEELVRRLDGLADRDRFSKGLTPREFVAGMETSLRTFETQTVESHFYDCTASTARGGDVFRRYVVTLAEIVAKVTTTSGKMVAETLHIRHHSENDELRILEDDDQLGGTLYFELKAAWLRAR